MCGYFVKDFCTSAAQKFGGFKYFLYLCNMKNNETMKTMKKQVISMMLVLAAILLAGCNGNGKAAEGGNADSTNVVENAQATADDSNAQADPAEMEKDVKARVCEIYDAVIAAYSADDWGKESAKLDGKFCSKDWKASVAAVKEKDKDAEMGFFEADYWVMGQDFQDLSYENVKVEEVLPEEGKAIVSLDWHNFGNVTKVYVDLVLEDGRWMVDELTDATRGDTGWKADMKEYLKGE